MAGFIYYMPGDKPPSRESLAVAGFTLSPLACVPGRQCLQGPDGGKGWLFVLAAPPTPDGRQPFDVYTPETQQWREGYDGKLWLGWENADPPNRADLQRKEEATGRPVTMADGKTWTIPVLRTRLGETTLPVTLGRGVNGTVVQCQVLPAFADLWGLVCKLWTAVSVEPAKLSDKEAFAVACLGLGLNYRVIDWEITHLGLFTTDTLAATLAALVDIPEAALDDQ